MDLPIDWPIDTFGNLYELQQGKALSRRRRQADASPSPFLRTSNVYWGRLDLNTVDTMDFTAQERERYQLLPGDLLICEGGDIGRTGIWRDELPNCYFQNHLFRARSRTAKAEPAFHLYWMQAAMTLLGLYQGTGNKTTIPNLSRSRLEAYELPLPPLAEQRRIAAVLNAIQEAIAAQEDVIAALRQFKCSLMQRLFTYGPGREPAETKETEIGEVPAHWLTIPFGEVALLHRGYDLPARERRPGPHPIVSSSGISGRHAEAKVKAPGIVTGRYGTLGKVYYIESDFWPLNTTLFVSDIKGNHPPFVARMLETLNLAALNDKTGVPGVNRNDAHRLRVSLPPLQEQISIAVYLEAVDARIATEEDRLAALQVLFRSTLHQLMTGQVRLPPDAQC